MKIDTDILKNWIILILLIVLGCLYIFQSDHTDQPIQSHTIVKTITIYKDKVDTTKKVVIKEKKAVAKLKAKKISYKIIFDSTATIDTVKIELIKADSSEKLKDSIIIGQEEIIHNQDIIIEDQAHIVSMTEANAKDQEAAQKKTIKILKRKLFFSRVATVTVTVGAVALIVAVL